MTEQITRSSPNLSALYAALAKAQGTMAGAKKDSENPHFRSKYSDLASCWEAAKSALPAAGLCVIQTTRTSDKDEVVVITRLGHASGEWIEGELSIPVSKADAQGYGSALTYARRYGLCAITGIAPEDDDGNAAAKSAPPARKAEPAPAAYVITEQEIADALMLLAEEAASGMAQVQHTMEKLPPPVQSYLREHKKAELQSIKKAATAATVKQEAARATA